jgi:hypothetical protein
VIEIEVQLRFRDFLQANYSILLRRSGTRILMVLAGLLAIFWIVVFFMFPDTSPWGGFVFPGLVIFMLASTYWSSKNHFESNRALQEPIRFKFAADGIEAKSATSAGRTEWINILEFVETRNSFLVFLATNLLYTIPKRCFVSEIEQNEFRKLLRTSIDPGRKRQEIKKSRRRLLITTVIWILVVLVLVLVGYWQG